MSDETSKTPNLDGVLVHHSLPYAIRSAVGKDMAAIEARHAEAIAKLRDSLDHSMRREVSLAGKVADLRESAAKHADGIKQARADLAYANAELAKERASIIAYRATLCSRDAENATLRAKMATMVCGTCKDKKWVPTPKYEDGPKAPCPVCQPKEGTL